MKKATDIMSKTGKWLLVFGFIFSQISFPIEVLAEELTTNENAYVEETNNEVLETNTDSNIPVNETVINIEELTEYTISIDEVTTVVFNYQGTECERIDFSNKLYGTYEYTFTLEETITITINYEGNNADLLGTYKLENETTKNISYTNDKCIISGFEESLVSVDSITTDYYDLTRFSEYYNASIEVIGIDDEPLYTGAVLRSGYNLVIVNNSVEETLTNGVLVSTNPKTNYTIVNDQNEIITNILEEKEITSMTDVNGDNKLSILDATHPTYIVVDKVETEEVLTNELTSSSEEILVGETVEVKLFVRGFDKLSLYGIEGLLNYDKNVLELVSANVYQTTAEEATLGDLNLENGKFAYVLNNGFNNESDAILTLTFKGVAEGTSEIAISNIINSYGENASLVETINTAVNVDAPEDNKGGDEEEDTTTEDTTTKEEETTEEVEEVVTKPVVRPVVLSSDYYIKNLSIAGYEIDFDMNTFEYSIKVGSDVTSLDLEVLLNDNNSIYYVEGNENFETGENLVYVVVKAENGSTKTYTIKVEKEKEVVKEEKNEIDEELDSEEENSTSKTVIIILIILVIIGLIYVIFKDDEEDAKPVEKKKETEKPKVVKVEKAKTESSKQTKQQPKKTTNSANNSKNKTTKKTNKK